MATEAAESVTVVSDVAALPDIELDGPAFFSKDDAKKLFEGKRIYFIGDSSEQFSWELLFQLIIIDNS